MIIKNLLMDRPVEIRYYDRNCPAKQHTLSIRGGGSVELDPRDRISLSLFDLKKLMSNGSILVSQDNTSAEKVAEVEPSVEDNGDSVVDSESTDSTPKDAENESSPELESESSEEPKEEDNAELTETEISNFKCEICGKEFASARGLSNHMKSHKN